MLKPSVDLKVRVVGGQSVWSMVSFECRKCAASWEITLPIENRLVNSCKGKNSRLWWWCFPAAKLWDSRRACESRPIRGQKQNLGRLKPTCGKHRLHKLAIPLFVQYRSTQYCRIY